MSKKKYCFNFLHFVESNRKQTQKETKQKLQKDKPNEFVSSRRSSLDKLD